MDIEKVLVVVILVVLIVWLVRELDTDTAIDMIDLGRHLRGDV